MLKELQNLDQSGRLDILYSVEPETFCNLGFLKSHQKDRNSHFILQ